MELYCSRGLAYNLIIFLIDMTMISESYNHIIYNLYNINTYNIKLDNRVILYLVIWIQKQGRSMRKKRLFIGFGSSVLHFAFRHLEFMHFYFLVLMLNLKQEKLKKIQGKFLKISAVRSLTPGRSDE